MLDETIITETPPLYYCYGYIGEQVRVPVTGNHDRRILHGTLNVRSGDCWLDITEDWKQEDSQGYLRMVGAHWRGWHIVLYEDRAPQHKAPGSMELAESLGIEIRLLPRATPELNAMDHLWKHAKREALGNRPIQSVDESALDVCCYILDLSPRERLRQAGVLSGNFWLTS
jgi:transposase